MCVHVCVRACMHACEGGLRCVVLARMCMCACVHTSNRACVHASKRANKRACLHAQVSIHAIQQGSPTICRHTTCTHVHVCMQACTLTFKHMHTHTPGPWGSMAGSHLAVAPALRDMLVHQVDPHHPPRPHIRGCVGARAHGYV